ncbi:phosphatidylinositol-4-phosphate 3-kinase, partial [Paragonimus westermani]
LDVGGPRLLRRRKSPKERELAFIPNSQASLELRQFASGIANFLIEQRHNACPGLPSDSCAFKLEDLSSFGLPAVGKTVWNATSVAFDPVYGHLATHQTHKDSLASERSCSEEKLCNPSWAVVTGARSVAHVRPLSTFKSDLDAETPSHWKNTARWIIPQLEVRITTHLRAGRKLAPNESSKTPTSTNCPTITDTNGPDSSTPADRTSTVPVTSRIRLVCDPNSTLVSELLMEALANDSITPYESNPSADDYQLRLHGRAELLHPDARMCDCSQVQLCHRLDQPLRLILEPRKFHHYSNMPECGSPPSFNPQSCFPASLRQTPNEEEIFITYSIFQNALEKARTIASRRSHSEDSTACLNQIHCVSSNLGQSVKAVLAVVCQTIAFTEVLNALGNVQVILMDIMEDLKKDLCKHASKKRVGEDLIPSMLKCKTDRPTLKTLPNTQRLNGLTLNGQLSEHGRAKLDRALANLEHCLLVQVGAFLDWQQLRVQINPILLDRCAQSSRTGTATIQPPRPRGLILDPETVTVSNGEDARSVRSSAACMDPFVVGVIAVHRMVQTHTLLHAPPGQKNVSPQHSPARTDCSMTIRCRSDTNLYVILSLVYAGRRLGQIYPRDSSSYISDFSSTRPSTQQGSTTSRDTFISDPGRLQTIQPGFPKVLQFDQWFKFPAFSISALPREALLSLSLFSCRKHSTENLGDGVLLGWVNVPLFGNDGLLIQNTVVAGLWPASDNALNEYRFTWAQPNRSSSCPVVQLCLPEYQYDIEFPIIKFEQKAKNNCSGNHIQLIGETKQAVMDASCALFMHTLDPELSIKAAERCLTAYCEAASTSRRSGRKTKSRATLPSLRLGALNSGSVGTFGITSGHAAPPYSTNSLIDAVGQPLPCPPAVAVEVLWNLRWGLRDQPDSLVALLIGVLVTWPQEAHGIGSTRSNVWTWSRLLREMYKLLSCSAAPSAGLAFRLLAPDIADQGVRHWAVRSLALLPPDVLLHHLPQALEVQLNAALQTTPASSPSGTTQISSSDWRYRRFYFLRSALLHLAGRGLRIVWQNQEEVIQKLSVAAVSVKHSKSGGFSREETLHSHLNSLMRWLNEDCRRSCLPDSIRNNIAESKEATLIDFDDAQEGCFSSDNHPSPTLSVASTNKGTTSCPSVFDVGFRLPYNPGLLTHRVDIAACTYFTSFTCPLRLVFHPLDTGAEPIMVMFKAGDDLRQDSLITQMAFLMDRIWLEAGLDLRMIHFRITPTGDRKGLIELVSECSTLRQIQQQGGGLTGPFKESMITRWLQSQNTTELDYKRALENFLRSLAGGCVMTYVLGVGDRHNDNIMIRYSGHLFHVDFAKVFGNVQTFAGIKRDRVPFVLTPDMLYVLQTYSRELNDAVARGVVSSISGHSSSSSNAVVHRDGVQLFIDYCCEAYNLLRREAYAILSVLDMGLSMNIPGITRDSVRFVLRALKLTYSEQQATDYFTELIRKTLQSRMPALNFFVHGLAQAKQTSVSGTSVASSCGAGHSNNTNGTFGSISRLDSFHCPQLPTSGSLNSRMGHIVSDALLSFSPKRFSFDEDGLIDAVMVEAAVKKRSADKHTDHYFPISVWRKNCRVPTRIFRRICDIAELCNAVRDAFPTSAVLSAIPSRISPITTNSLSSVQAQSNVQKLLDLLLEEDEVVGKSDLLCTFFHSLLFDEKFAAEEALHLTNAAQFTFWTPTPPYELSLLSGEKSNMDLQQPLLTPAVGTSIRCGGSRENLAGFTSTDTSPALQLQFCLNDSAQRLDILIKHGRALKYSIRPQLIPGSRELPDVYVKVYLLSGRRKKSTKRKTGIIRHSSSPSFNASHVFSDGFLFLYSLLTNSPLRMYMWAFWRSPLGMRPIWARMSCWVRCTYNFALYVPANVSRNGIRSLPTGILCEQRQHTHAFTSLLF